MAYERFIGLEYESRGRGPEAFDCWGLCIHAGRELFGLAFPDYLYDSADRQAEAALTILGAINADGWVSVERPDPGDIVVMRIRGIISHTGLMVDSTNFLHSLRGRNSALERVADWTQRITTYRRFTR